MAGDPRRRADHARPAGDPDALLAEHAQTLDAAYREVGGRLAVNTEVRVDDAGKIHLTRVKAIEEPPSLVDLRGRTTAMLPRVDLPEVILEVMSWVPELARRSPPCRAAGPGWRTCRISIAACLAAHSMNVGYRPIASKGVPGPGTVTAVARLPELLPARDPRSLANAPLVARQAGCRSPRRGAAGWSQRSTGCGSSSRSRPRSPAPTASTSAPSAA